MGVIALKDFQRRLNILPNAQLTQKQLPNNFKILPIWKNLAKFGHTARDRPIWSIYSKKCELNS